MLDRRNFLSAAAVAAAVPAFAGVARAQTPEPAPRPEATPTPVPRPDREAQVPAYYRTRVGDAVVTAVGDGSLLIDPEALPSISRDEFAAHMRANFLPEGPYRTALNTFVIETGDNVVLVDAGMATMAPTTGRLLPNLAAAGYAPADITHVLLTHMHGDHIAGLLDGAGAAVFPAANVVVRDRELRFWTDPAEAGSIPEPQRGMVPLATAVAKAYEGRVVPFADDVEVVAGIDAVALYGHTPGHTGYRVRSGPGLLIWGDVVHVPPVQLAKPETGIGYDVMGADAIATRRRILEQIVADRTLVAGMHVPFPSFGHITTEGAGYRHVPVPFDAAL